MESMKAMTQLLVDRERGSQRGGDPLVALKSFLDPLSQSAKPRMRWKGLRGHTGCVNALAFSSLGNHLYSGGDDQRVLMWRADSSAFVDPSPTPSGVMRGEHGSNIFCLDGDVTEAKVVSGGNDWRAMVHDITTGKTLDVYLHEDSIHGVATHPSSSAVFATACSDGRATLFDMRMSHPDQEGAMQLTSSPSGKPCLSVHFNPSDERLILVSSQDDDLGASLYDVRKPGEKLIKYGKRRGPAMFARFDSRGEKVLVIARRRNPEVFTLRDTSPLCSFDSPGYYNNCTMKSGCFGGINDTFVLAGSDDFNLYAWEIPDGDDSSPEETLVARASVVLRGHKSIVNQVRCRSSDGLIASSGVEKCVNLWSGGSMPGSETVPAAEEAVQLIKDSRCGAPSGYRPYFDVEGTGGGAETPTAENPGMLSYFDQLIFHESVSTSSSSPSTEDTGDEEGPMKSSRFAGGCDDDTPTDSSTSTADEGADISKIIERKRALLARKRRKRQRQSRNRPVKTRFLTQRLMADGFTLRPTNNQTDSSTPSSASSGDDEDTSKPRLAELPLGQAARGSALLPSYFPSSSSSSDNDGEAFNCDKPSTSSFNSAGGQQTSSSNIRREILAALKADIGGGGGASNSSSSSGEEPSCGDGTVGGKEGSDNRESAIPNHSAASTTPENRKTAISTATNDSSSAVAEAKRPSASSTFIKLKLKLDSANSSTTTTTTTPAEKPQFKKRLCVKGTNKSYRRHKQNGESDTSDEEGRS